VFQLREHQTLPPLLKPGNAVFATLGRSQISLKQCHEMLFPFSCAFLLGDPSLEVFVTPLFSNLYHLQHGEERKQGRGSVELEMELRSGRVEKQDGGCD